MDYLFYLASLVGIFAILGASLDLLVGHTGLFSLAHAAFLGLGAYAAALLGLRLGVPFLPAVLLGACLAALASLVVSLAAWRLRGEALVLATFGAQMLFSDAAENWVSLTRGPLGLPNVPRPTLFGHVLASSGELALLVGAVAAGAWLVTVRLTSAPYGRVLHALREDETFASVLGKDVRRMKASVLAVSCFLAGLAGGLYAHLLRFIDPSSFTVQESVLVLATIIIGGAGTRAGPIAGAALLVLLPEGLRFVGITGPLAANLKQTIYGALLVIVVLFRPEGLLALPAGRQRALPEGPGDAGGPPEPPELLPGPDGATGQPLVCENLTKRFGGVAAVAELTLRLPPRGAVAIVGPNGAGKTTLLSLIAGLLLPDDGRIFLGGQDLTVLSIQERARRGLARTFQEPRLIRRLTALEHVWLARPDQRGERLLPALFGTDRRRRVADLQACERGLRKVGLSRVSGQRVGELSYGQQKLLALACALATGAGTLLLDEPTAGVQPATKAQIVALLRALKQEGKLVVFVEHDLSVVRQLADLLIVMAKGRVLATGAPDEVLQRPIVHEAYLD